MSYIPSLAARWISAITLRSKVADSRNPGCQPPLTLAPISVAPEVLDVKVVERPRGPVTAKLGCLHVAHVGAPQQLSQLLEVLLAHVLLDAVGAEAGDRPPDVQARLVEGVAERFPGVAAHHERSSLGHERAHV